MNKNARIWVLALVIALVLVPHHSVCAKGGIDRSKIRSVVQVYPATLTIGDMSFRGTLSRMDKLTDGEIEKAIKDALKDMGLTELEVSEAQDAVDKGEKAETMTKEDVDRVLKNLMKLAGVDSLYDLIVALGDANVPALLDVGEGYATDQAKEKAIAWILEQAAEGAGEAAGMVTKLLDMTLISAEQYERDQDKWKTRVDAANAQRTLNEFYYRVNDRIDGQKGMRSRGWVLLIDDSASHNFTFYTTEGNLQIWTVNMILKKFDVKQDTGPSGTYSGVVFISVEYEMSPFDQGFADWAINKSGMLDAQKNHFQKMAKAGAVSSFDITYDPDEYDPTYIHRTLDSGDYSTQLTVPAQKGNAKSRLDFSSFSDTKETAIHHKLIVNFTTGGKVKYNVTGTMDYSCQNEDKMNWNYSTSGSMTMQGKTLSGSSDNVSYEKDLDQSIWEQWDKEKWLEITYP